MIIRSWKGETAKDQSGHYLNHLRRSVIPDLRKIHGFKDIFVLRREIETGYEFSVLTLWESMDVIRQFAGEDTDRAVVPPDAQAVLSRFDDHVIHYEAIIQPGGSS